MKSTKWIWFLVSGMVIFLDQLSKYEALQYLIPYHPKKIIPMYNLTLAFNSGSAFSFLSNAGEWHRYFLTGFSGLMSLILIIWMSRTSARSHWQLLGLSLILGGALGNLIDRIMLGHVVDFIDVYYQTLHWPVFNLADSAVCVGAVILLFSM